ncbi:MAG: hypothetical protein Q7S31_00735 [bacterium]|nr:hypothetical protein [bacterium]
MSFFDALRARLAASRQPPPETVPEIPSLQPEPEISQPKTTVLDVLATLPPEEQAVVLSFLALRYSRK